MKRREFMTLVGGAALACPRPAYAQQDGRIARVGVMTPPLGNPGMRFAYPLFLAELRKLGFVESRNLFVEHRRTDQTVPQLLASANELVAGKAEVLFVWGGESALEAAIAARPVIPIVMGAINFDPIAKGFVQSLSRPGGNVTGVVARQVDLAPKLIELLQEAFPGRNRLGVLWDAQSASQFSAAQREVQARQLALRPLKMEHPPYDFAAAFRALVQDGAQMLLVFGSPLFSRQAATIASLAIEHRLPAMFTLKHYVEAGGLMGYGVDFSPLMRRVASHIAKILRGAKPADLPVEQAVHFEFVVNLKTAKAMNIALPTSILLRADEVIE
jgi:putative ABC transport system substrate-binding protein